ncbi:MAG TPA: YggT family protein [Gammaproteobacteria bacterium]|nr:YggT family protein [Gammaproteobacteria bacterium]
MGGSYWSNPLQFLVSTLFSLYILAVMLRLLLASSRADFYNPVSQFLVRITNPLVIPLRRVIPPIGRLDTATVVLLLALQALAVILGFLIRDAALQWPVIILLSVAELVGLVFNIYIFAILIQAILSWVNPGTYNPVTSLLYSLTEPVLGPVRRMIPPISGIDLSPLFALIGLQVLKMLVLPLLLHVG